jgi:hypothetical protein
MIQKKYLTLDEAAASLDCDPEALRQYLTDTKPLTAYMETFRQAMSFDIFAEKERPTLVKGTHGGVSWRPLGSRESERYSIFPPDFDVQIFEVTGWLPLTPTATQFLLRTTGECRGVQFLVNFGQSDRAFVIEPAPTSSEEEASERAKISPELIDPLRFAPYCISRNDIFFLAEDIDAMRQSIDADKSPRSGIANGDGKALDTRERIMLLTIIGALAEPAKLDLSQHNKAGETVAAMLAAKGVTASGRAIGEHLKAVREAMDSRKVK